MRPLQIEKSDEHLTISMPLTMLSCTCTLFTFGWPRRQCQSSNGCNDHFPTFAKSCIVKDISYIVPSHENSAIICLLDVLTVLVWTLNSTFNLTNVRLVTEIKLRLSLGMWRTSFILIFYFTPFTANFSITAPLPIPFTSLLSSTIIQRVFSIPSDYFLVARVQLPIFQEDVDLSTRTL